MSPVHPEAIPSRSPSFSFPSPIWQVQDPPSAAALERLTRETRGQFSALATRVFASRGLLSAADVERFVSPGAESLLDPHTMLGMDALVHRLMRAVAEREPVLVHGDYDCDGITTAVLYARVLDRLGVPVLARTPLRERDGYGVSVHLLEEARSQGIRLVLTGDTGASAAEEIAHARSIGLEVWVTDHHLPGDAQSAGVNMVNPNQPGCGYAHKALSGVGVAFKVMCALARGLGRSEAELVWPYLDLVALGTAADVVSLRHPENRWIVRQGLDVAQRTSSVGLRSLAELAGRDVEALADRDLAWALAPRLNSAGRLANANTAVRLLLTDDPEEAQELAREISEIDARRKQMSGALEEEACTAVLADGCGDEHAAFVGASVDWHPAILGIAAGRVAERLGRPVVLLAPDPRTGTWTGSARAGNPHVHLRDLVAQCETHLLRFGGHRGAAGLTLKEGGEAALAAFSEAFRRQACAVLPITARKPVLRLDCEARLSEMNPEVHAQVQRLAPFGEGNRPPRFLVRGVRVVSVQCLKERHLKLIVEQDGVQMKAIGFGLAARMETPSAGTLLDLACEMSVNVWNSRTTLELKVDNVRSEDPGSLAS